MAVGAGVVTGIVGLAVACAGAGAANAGEPWDAVTYSYTGAPVLYTVPPAVGHLSLVGVGGHGGVWGFGSYNAGALITGTLTVTPGEQLRVSVGGNGGDAAVSSHDIPGGWGGLGASGGVGNGAKHDHLRSGGAGGGATTVEALIDGAWQTVFIAGGGGGDGGPSGDRTTGDYGGGAGWAAIEKDTCQADKDSWKGSDGSNGSSLFGGTGGAAAAQAGMAGGRGQGGSGLGGNGGGGGGGVIGGAGGGGAKGTSSGGGGGAGSSANYLLDEVTVTNAHCGHSGTFPDDIAPRVVIDTKP